MRLRVPKSVTTSTKLKIELVFNFTVSKDLNACGPNGEPESERRRCCAQKYEFAGLQ